ncbi:hypothetical protein AMJ80_03490 [bacterium SM23_31]|nr:MAG: hypothetical protein AMJ80_03490 [bacterium SM23_31]
MHENLKTIENSILFVIGLLLSFALFGLLSQDSLRTKELQDEYERLSEFLRNQQIFHSYLDQKRDLYWELNKKAAESDSTKESITLAKYGTYVPLFQFRGGWGWDERSLDDRYSFGAVVEDIFLGDWNYWTTAGKTELKKRWPNLPDEFLDIEKRLKVFIDDDQFLINFFISDLELKLRFIKDLLKQYDIALDDKIFNEVKVPIVGDYKESFVSFLNDSVRVYFSFILPFSLIFSENWVYFYELNDANRAICEILYKEYIKKKFTVWDPEIFDDRLPYSSYVDRVTRKKLFLEKKLGDKIDTSNKIKPPLVPAELDITFFYKVLFWLFPVSAFVLRNLLTLREKVKKNVDRSTGPETIANNIGSALISALVLYSKDENKTLRKSTFLILTILPIGLLVGITLPHYQIVYGTRMAFIVLAIIPIILTTLLFFFRFDRKSFVTMRQSNIASSRLNRFGS